MFIENIFRQEIFLLKNKEQINHYQHLGSLGSWRIDKWSKCLNSVQCLAMLLIISMRGSFKFSMLLSGLWLWKPSEERTPHFLEISGTNCRYDIYASDESNCWLLFGEKGNRVISWKYQCRLQRLAQKAWRKC